MIEPEKPHVQEALRRILASPGFQSSERMSAFLRFVVQYKLDGEQGPLKEYLIADRVFGRSESFDPRTDTIVRVEARRLRAKLQKYYRNDGRDDPVVIELAGRGYTPIFRATVPPASSPPAERTQPWVMAAGVTVLCALAAWSWLPLPREALTDSIAVLPCANLTDPDAALSDGLTIEIGSALAAVPGLRVVARTSAFQFKGRDADLRKIAKDLGVKSVLECSVRKEGQRVRVTAQLANGEDGSSLWSGTFDRQIDSAFEVQTEITRSIVDALRIRLTSTVEARLRPETTNRDARELYWKGRLSWDRGTPTDLEKSVDYMERAIEADPEYAAAHAGLADALSLQLCLETNPSEKALQRLKWAARKAVALDEGSAEGHSALGGVLASEGDWHGAEREFLLAIHLKPSLMRARHAYAVLFLAPLRRYEEAVAQLREAVRLDPISAVPRTFLGQTLTYSGRPDAAVTELNEALEYTPDYVHAKTALALAYLAKESYGKALEQLQYAEISGSDIPYYWGLLGYTHAKLGNQPEAEKILRRLRDGTQGSAIDVAGIYRGLGDTNATLDWLEIGRRQLGAGAAYVIDDPRFRSLQSDPRFVSLLKQMGLPV